MQGKKINSSPAESPIGSPPRRAPCRADPLHPQSAALEEQAPARGALTLAGLPVPGREARRPSQQDLADPGARQDAGFLHWGAEKGRTPG